MKILWIAPGLPASITDPAQASLASHRYRVLLPAQALRQSGHDVQLENLEQPQQSPASALADFRPETVIVGKLLPVGSLALPTLAARLFALLAAARAACIPVLADINDDHFGHPVLGPYWQQLLACCDGVISGSPAMSAVIARYQPALPLAVVGDPAAMQAGLAEVWQGSGETEKSGWGSRLLHRLLPAEVTRPRLRMVWYGSPGNWPSMAVLARELAGWSAEQPFLLDIVCAEDEKIETFVDDYNRQHGPDACLDLLPWSVATTEAAIARAHLVLIPADLSDPTKTVKTANRLIDAIQAGRFVVAAEVPAYQEFSAFAWLGQDLLSGIRWYLAQPEQALAKIRAGQAYIAARYTPEKIAGCWLEAVTSLQQAAADQPVEARTDVPAVAGLAAGLPALPEGAVRLNLGCGDKILPGYVNVDVAPSRRGLKPDVLCDLRDLSVFPDHYADEILSVHVVEHFWRWEVADILKEWVRVLKPGGRMIVECPNLITACQTLLANPELASQPGPAGQRSMWVLYGDPAWQDPLMIHRWGYTPHSLEQLLAEAGLVQIEQTPAQYKLREPRDMRLEGVRPF